MMNFLLQGNALFALAAAMFWGGGDFGGSMATKRAGGTAGAALRVVVLSHTISMCLILTIAALRGDGLPTHREILFGVVAGIANGLALVVFYMSLANSAMGASAAISGLAAAAMPAVVSAFVDGTPGWRKFVGFIVAAVAIWLIAGTEGEHELAEVAHVHTKVVHRTTWLALTSGVGFGIFFTLLKWAGNESVFYPIASTRVGSITTCALTLGVLLWGRKRRGEGGPAGEGLNKKAVRWVLGGLVMDTSGNLFYVAATQHGRLDVAAVLGSLYPASTILLAGRILGEKTTRRQNVGFVVALMAVLLITV